MRISLRKYLIFLSIVFLNGIAALQASSCSIIPEALLVQLTEDVQQVEYAYQGGKSDIADFNPLGKRFINRLFAEVLDIENTEEEEDFVHPVDTSLPHGTLASAYFYARFLGHLTFHHQEVIRRLTNLFCASSGDLYLTYEVFRI